jgi:hypothetical protein
MRVSRAVKDNGACGRDSLENIHKLAKKCSFCSNLRPSPMQTIAMLAQRGLLRSAACAAAPPRSIDVLFRDENFIVVNKPFDVVTQAEGSDDTVEGITSSTTPLQGSFVWPSPPQPPHLQASTSQDDPRGKNTARWFLATYLLVLFSSTPA